MGTEARGTVTVGGQKVNVKADFASDHVTFSGGRRGEVKYTDMEVLGTGKGLLRLRVDGAAMEFPLGDKVDRIAAKIRKPPTRLDKLGVKPGLAVAVLGMDKGFVAEASKVAQVAEALPKAMVDILFFGLRQIDDLEGLADLRSRFKPEGALWLVYPKGRRDLSENAIIEASRAAGLKDVKVVRFSPTHTALKFVRPLSDR